MSEATVNNSTSGGPQEVDVAMANACGMLAAAITSDVGLDMFAQTLMSGAMPLLGADGAAILFADERGRLTLSAASDRAAGAVGQLAERVNSSPAHAVLGLRRSVVDAVGDATGRWPEFSAAASAAGYRWCCAMPLRMVDRCVGAILLLRADPHPFAGRALRLTQSLFDMASATLHLFGELTTAQTLASQLQTALNTRIVIEQAKGMLAANGNMSPDEAFSVLRRFARSHNLNLRALAEEVVAAGGRCDATHAPAAVSA